MRVKKKVYTNVSTDQAEEAASQYVKAQNRLNVIEAKMNEELTKVRNKYQDQITGLKEEQEEPYEVLSTYASEQKESWGKKKSLEMLHAVIGFRTGTPKVTKDKRFTWDAVLEMLKKNSLFSGFVRTKEEINKEAILAERDEAIVTALNKEAYISIDQDETFFVTVKMDEVAA